MLKPGDHIVDFADDYLHDLLSASDSRYVKDHCATCAICQLAMEEAGQRQALLRSLPMAEPSEQLIRQTMSKITGRDRRRRNLSRNGWRIFLGALAAAAVFVAAAHLYFANLSPSPYDLKVLAESDFLSDTQASLRAVVMRNDDAKALADVPVAIDLLDTGTNASVHLADFRTNADGTGQPEFRLPDWKDGDYQLRITAKPGGESETLNQSVKLRRSWKLMLSSDKPVYQPGQTIHLRSLALRQPDLHPVAGQEAVFTLADPKGNVLFKQRTVTSRFGISWADCPLADEILEGAYQVHCAIGDTASESTVEVKKYVLPKFKIDLNADKPFYQPGDRIRLKVQAGYFFGKPVAAGDVTVVCTDLTGVEPAKVITDEKGSADCQIQLPDHLIGQEQDSGDARISLDVLLRDTAGQEQHKMLSRVVTDKPLRIEVIPEAGGLAFGVADRVYVLTTYADGRPAAVRVAVSGLEQELQSSALGVCSFETTPKAQHLDLTVSASDAAGLHATRQVSLKCGEAANSFVIRTDKAVYNGGDTVKLIALGGGNQPVFVDMIKDGQTLLTRTVEMNNGDGDLSLDLPAEIFGTLQLNAYRLGSAGLAVRQSRVMYVRPAGQLRVDVTPDQPQYRPGESATLALSLHDAAGKPVPGAISLAAVDEAVFSVADQAPGMEGTFFNLEQELLKPIYSIYDWSPNADTSSPPWVANDLEQALFARASAEAVDNRAATARAALQRAVDAGQLSPDIMDVLNRPDVGQLLENSGVDEPYLSMIKQSAGVNASVQSSYPEKVREVAQRSESGVQLAEGGWIVLAIISAVAVFVWLYQIFGRPTVMTVVGVLFCGFCLTSVMLPSLNKARETADRAKAASNLNQMGLALMLADSEKPAEVKQGASGANTPPRVRQWFPETLLWRPELITDDQGNAKLDVDLADSITNWRLSASAVTTDGRMGATQAGIRVFQPFFVDMNLPVAMTRGDEVAVPVAVYNYSDHSQTVHLKLEPGNGWFELLDDAAKQVQLAGGEVRSTSFRLRIKKVGSHELQVSATCDGLSDAVRRSINIIPDGRVVEQITNGTLQRPLSADLTLPSSVIDGSAKLLVKIYPSSFSQLVEGLDGIFQMPYGCFEQTSSTTYPNVLALAYLHQTGKSAPAVEAKAREYIQLGYQRLVGFEVPGGGFDWFGHPAATVTLTAYGLMEFQDMASVSDVDPELIKRTRQWLLARRKADGSWAAEPDMLHDGLAESVQRGNDLNLVTSAYVAWSVFGGPDSANLPEAAATRDYLRAQAVNHIDDPYVLAVLANAQLVLDTTGQDAIPALDRLEQLKQTSADGKTTWWDQLAATHTTFYGSGPSGSIETTAMATLAMIHADRDPSTVRGALAWLIQQRDVQGTWNSTQATVLALKALVAGTGKPLGGDKARRLHLVMGSVDREITVTADQAEVMQLQDLSDQLHAGQSHLSLSDETGTASGFQVAFRYNVPGEVSTSTDALSITLDYDRTDLLVGQALTATATITNNSADAAPMVILDLPIPAGFGPKADDFDKMVASGTIAKYEFTPRMAIVYLRSVKEPLHLTYRFTATMPVQIRVPAAQAYEYYDPAKRGSSKVSFLTVSESRG